MSRVPYPQLFVRLLSVCLLLSAFWVGPSLAHESQDPPSEAAEGEAKEDVEDESWDVMEPPLETYEVAIDVDEGTWISVDVSPDGSELVFDLLGDLYVLPMGGGDARPLTSGLAWDMQPRFSPDGKSIAFTSDRGGGDNLWIVDRDGENPRAVTEEAFRLLNNPVWTPDGEYVAGRKHFTSGRSLGAGEIWLYHKSGGSGVQMVERPNDQKDLGEPAFSPDGRYLYYSLDATPGGVFQYNKDPNTEIYVIRRLDRQTGETVDMVIGPGGAIRPTPSPDGKQLAFIRRVRFKSVLFVKDLESGEERALYDDLDRDFQETWAVHGVYSNMAWTPDSSEIVFWAGGKIHRLAVADGGLREIPFRVKDTRQVVEALRFPTPVAPERFDVKMLRWVTVSPDGGRVVYQALGKLWVRDLPEGQPRRLTSQDDHVEIYPSFSRDGRSIVYATWDDGELGAVRVAPASGGEGRVVTTQPGHYVEPIFTPDGSQIVFRKTEGGFLRTPGWSLEPGIYRIPADGGDAVFLSRSGARPHFGAEADRVYLRRRLGAEERGLVSVSLEDGHDERTHLTTTWGADFRVSPDGLWVAWVERFQVYAAPFPAIGKPLALGPSSKALPVKKVSQDAGAYLHWSGDSASIHFSVGPELFTRPLPEIFAFNGEGSAGEETGEDKSDGPEPGLAIGFSAESGRPTGTLALVGGRVVTMRGDEVLEDGTVVIEGDRITAVGPEADVGVPVGARVIDVAGKTLVPGFVDVHWHGAMATDGIVPQQGWPNYATLAYGVTTIHDPSNDTASIFAAAELAQAGEVLAPRIYSTGTILYGATTTFTAEVDSLDDARSHLRRMQAVGAVSVKSYNQPRRDQRQQFIKGAQELEMLVFPEGGSLLQHNLTMVIDGHTGIEHAVPVAEIYDDVRQLWIETRTGYTPTLTVAYGGIWGENYWYAKTDVWADERLMTFVPRSQVDPLARRPFQAPDEEYNHFDAAEIASELAAQGVIVTVGAHGQREGLGSHWEMWMLEQGGMTPHQALRAGTLEGARYLGMEADLGSLEAGKLADIVVLGSNPLEDLRRSTDIDQIVLGGRLYDARSLNQLAPETREREFFFFEGDNSAVLTREAPPEAICSHH